MDEFTNIAIWLVIIYLSINASIFWFANSTTFVDNGLGLKGITEDKSFTLNENPVINFLGFQFDCSTASSNPFSFVPCSLAEVSGNFNTLKDTIWNLLTAWSNLIGSIFPENTALGDLGEFIQNIVGPIFGGIALLGIFVILLRVAGIVRGGS